jgi:hypothetical protein
VTSNIAFSVPVLLPWLLLSGVADLILALPFDLPRQVLTSPEGETAYFLFFLVCRGRDRSADYPEILALPPP